MLMMLSGTKVRAFGSPPPELNCANRTAQGMGGGGGASADRPATAPLLMEPQTPPAFLQAGPARPHAQGAAAFRWVIRQGTSRWPLCCPAHCQRGALGSNSAPKQEATPAGAAHPCSGVRARYCPLPLRGLWAAMRTTGARGATQPEPAVLRQRRCH